MVQKQFWNVILCVICFFKITVAVDKDVLSAGQEKTHQKKSLNGEDEEPFEDEPNAINFYPPKVKLVSTHRDINCETFSDYALNCTMNAAVMYNSNRKSPPKPKKIHDWCKAVKYLTNCALEWNMDCRDVTDSHFNEESINGHSYVVHNICDDKVFLEKYMDIETCVEKTADQWETCYTNFKGLVDGFKKNTSSDWTHYETHFHLCCGRARFRRCVLDLVFNRTDACSHSQAITLQKFSVIVSEGDVYQECDINVLYAVCPGGNPIASRDLITDIDKFDNTGCAHRKKPLHNLFLSITLIWNVIHLVVI